MRKPIVILGGMGPQASLRLHQLLMQESLRYHNGSGDDFPYVVHFSLPVADFISDVAAQEAAAQTLRGLNGTIRALEPASILLACNTAHLLAKEVPLLRRAPFVSMPETVADRLAQRRLRHVGLLATPNTIRSGLYRRVFSRRGIATIAPSAPQRRQLEAAIRSVIAGELNPTHQKKLLAIAGSLERRGAEAIVLGCTELPLLFPASESPLPTFDCLQLLAEAAINQQYCIMEK